MIVRNMYGVNDVMMTYSGTQNFGQNFISPQVAFNLPATTGMYMAGRGNSQAPPGYGFVANSNSQSVQRQRYDYPNVNNNQRNFQVTSSSSDSRTMQQPYYPTHPDRTREYPIPGNSERGSYSDRYENLDSVYHGTSSEGHTYRSTGESSNMYSSKVDNRGVFNAVHDERNVYNVKPALPSYDSSGRTFFTPAVEKYKGYDPSKVMKWNQKDSFMEIDRETESYLAQVGEDQLELEHIAATLKEDCQSPSSLELFLQNDIFASTAPPPISGKEGCTQVGNERPQYLDLSNASSRVSSTQFQAEDYSLSLGLKALQSPGVYRNFGTDSFPNSAQCVQGVQQMRALSDSASGSYPYLHSDTSGDMTFSKSLPTFSDTLDLDVFFEEQNERKDAMSYAESNWRHINARRGNTGYMNSSPKAGRRRSLAANKPDCKLQGDSSRPGGSRSKLKLDKARALKLPAVDLDRIERDKVQCRPGDSPKENIEPNHIEHSVEETKRDGRRRKYYFENEENYEVCKLLRELSAIRTPKGVPPTTAASLFYRQLTNEAEPRIMKTVQPVPNEKGRKIVIRKDIPEEKIGKYSKVGSSPFVYMHGSPSPDGGRSASLKLVELLTTKVNDDNSEPTSSGVENENNISFSAEVKLEPVESAAS